MDARAVVLRVLGERPCLDEVESAIGRERPFDVLRTAEVVFHASGEFGHLLCLLVGQHWGDPQSLRHFGHSRVGLAVGGRPDHASLCHDFGSDGARHRIDEEVVDVGLLLDDALTDPVRGGDDVVPRPVAGSRVNATNERVPGTMRWTPTATLALAASTPLCVR